MSKELVKAIADMREEEALTLASKMMEDGRDPTEILDAAREAMGIVGERYQEGVYFLPELMMAGEMLTQISDVTKSKMAQTTATGAKHLGKVVIGTVQGDIHDIGKDIVTFMLDVNGFEVHDLGVDVPPQKFVEAVQDLRPQVVGLSGFLTLAFDAMKDTVAALKAAGLRDQVKIMIGGGQIDERIREYTGADAWGRDAMAAVNLAKQWKGA